jgi:Sec-independent protein translocase protein TatA
MLLVVVLRIFGAKRPPETRRALGHGMREFKEAITGRDRTMIHPPPQPQTVQHPALAAKRTHTHPR